MRTTWTRGTALVTALVAGLAGGCGKDGGTAGAPAMAQTDGADGLKAVLTAIVKAAESGDRKTAASLTRGLMPDKGSIGKALRDGVPTETTLQVLELFAASPAEDADAARLLLPGDPARTELVVHAATTEEIARYEAGSVAYDEFPGGARKLAETILRPGVTFYEAEWVEPGKDAGMKYHLFYWDGQRWRMLGPAWRVVKP